jgi:hypothetical protein
MAYLENGDLMHGGMRQTCSVNERLSGLWQPIFHSRPSIGNSKPYTTVFSLHAA